MSSTVTFSSPVDNILDELKRFPLVFVHVGELFCPDFVEDEVFRRLDSATSSAEIVQLTDLSSSAAAQVKIVVGFEELASRSDRCEILANVRAHVMSRLDLGERVVLLSRVPKLHLLGCRGSQLVTDARAVFVQHLTDVHISESVLDEYDDATAARVVSLCVGLPQLANALLEIARTETSPGVLQARSKDLLQTTISKSICKLGWEVVSFLESVLIKGPLPDSIPIDEPTALVSEALRGAGLARVSPSGEFLELVLPKPAKIGELSVRKAVDSFVDPPKQVGDIALSLWEIERFSREILKAAAIKQHDNNWKQNGLSAELQRRAVERFGKDNLRDEVTLNEIPNPLEWLTLDEIAEVFETKEWAKIPDLPPVFWKQLRLELIPIRNRFAHFRLPRKDDCEKVSRWRSQLRSRYSVQDS